MHLWNQPLWIPTLAAKRTPSHLWIDHPRWLVRPIRKVAERHLKDIHDNKWLRGNGELEEDDEVSVASKADDVASANEADEEESEVLEEDAPINNC